MNLYKNIFELFTIKRIIHEQKRLFCIMIKTIEKILGKIIPSLVFILITPFSLAYTLLQKLNSAIRKFFHK